MSVAIKVENLSKAYQLGEIGTGTISRDVERWVAKLRGKEDPFLKIGEANNRAIKGTSDVVWSLKDINFEIQQGDAVGIIGRNGAGKSTLLKILSRVTSPTTGKINGKGRIASLLEVGTGFHPELTGKENIYLNGAILGMRNKEITRKFEEIVDFAGIERYIDTPVKRYSSGMYVRLAFAVAAHLESEILIVDEVLAVGDAEFQKRCLGKMDQVSKGEGRTVLFVSHQMRVIQNLCNRTIILSNGTLGFNGNLYDGLQFYENLIRQQKAIQNIEGFGLDMEFYSNQIANPKTLHSGDSITFLINIYAPFDVNDNNINICFDNTAGDRIIQMRNDWNNYIVELKKGINTFKIKIDNILLTTGIYDIWCRVVVGKEKKIIDTNFVSLEIRGEHTAGYIAHLGKWSREN